MDLLFSLAHWHALAKLRQHTDLSLAILESVTIQLGELLRKFQTITCSAYDTRELDREVTARARQTASKSTANQGTLTHASSEIGREGQNPSDFQPSSESKAKKSAGRLPKTLNLNTYKDHSVGDYVDSIRQFGTVDSYSTEPVSIVLS